MGRHSRNIRLVYEAISADIYRFCDAMNFRPNNHQRLLFDAVMDAEYGRGPLQIAVKSGQGTGKTAGSVVVALWRCLRAVDAMTILTAPTMRQCNEVWLAEARRLLAVAEPFIAGLFEVTKTKVQIAGRSDWGVKTVTASKEENAQGFHEKNMTIICEEASGIMRPIIEQFKGTASNPNCLFLMIGNPNTRDCGFFDCFNSLRHLWKTLTFNAEDTPRSEWFDPKRNKDLEEEFGKDSDVYRIRVLGEFPHSDPNCVVSSEELEKICDRRRYLDAVTASAVKQIGLDFARFGSDESAIYRRTGNAIAEWEKFAHTEPDVVVDRAFRMQVEALWRDKDCVYVADATGIGQGIMHKFYNAGKRIVEFHNGGRAIAANHYDNKITEAWFQFARLARTGNAYIPNDNVLIQQLCSRQYFTNKKGLMVLESKDDYMDRGHDSPDRADACVTAFWEGATATAQFHTQGESVHRAGSTVRIAGGRQ